MLLELQVACMHVSMHGRVGTSLDRNEARSLHHSIISSSLPPSPPPPPSCRRCCCGGGSTE